MEKLKKKLEDLNIKKLNDIFKITNNVLKILYFLLIVVAIYIIVLILKEWKIVPILLSLLKLLSPFFIGFVIAWLLNPLVSKLTTRGMRRIPAIILVYFLLILFLYFFTLLVIPSIASQINDLVASIPVILSDAQNIINNIFDKLSSTSLTNLDSVKETFFARITDFAMSLSTNLPELFVSFVKSMVSGIGIIVFGFIIGFYMLFNFDKVNDYLLKFLPKKHREEGKELISAISLSLHSYVKGTLLISFIVFIINTIGFSIIGLNAPLMFGLFCGITNLIPYLGPYIGGIPAVLIGLSQSTLTGLLVLILIVIVQTLEGMFLQPIIMSKKMNLSPITIIIMLLIFGAFFGIIGMILATPIAALIKIIYIFLDKKYNFFGYTEENYHKEKSKVKKQV